MKRFIVLSILLAFVIGLPAAVLANDGEYKNAAQFCKANDNLGYSDRGECVGLFKASYRPGNSGAVAVCKEFIRNTPDKFYGQYNNLDECISHLTDGYVAD